MKKHFPPFANLCRFYSDLPLTLSRFRQVIFFRLKILDPVPLAYQE